LRVVLFALLLFFADKLFTIMIFSLSGWNVFLAGWGTLKAEKGRGQYAMDLLGKAVRQQVSGRLSGQADGE
jgi:hypothetical protein